MDKKEEKKTWAEISEEENQKELENEMQKLKASSKVEPKDEDGI